MYRVVEMVGSGWAVVEHSTIAPIEYFPAKEHLRGRGWAWALVLAQVDANKYADAMNRGGAAAERMRRRR